MEAKATASSEFLGNVKDKIKIDATIIFEKAFMDRRYPSYMYKFLTTEGSVVVWYASNPLPLHDKEYVVTVGAKVKLSGTIKELKTDDRYNVGQKFTVVTRCAVEVLSV
jgi:hypothetical protein